MCMDVDVHPVFQSNESLCFIRSRYWESDSHGGCMCVDGHHHHQLGMMESFISISWLSLSFYSRRYSCSLFLSALSLSLSLTLLFLPLMPSASWGYLCPRRSERSRWLSIASVSDASNRETKMMNKKKTQKKKKKKKKKMEKLTTGVSVNWLYDQSVLLKCTHTRDTQQVKLDGEEKREKIVKRS